MLAEAVRDEASREGRVLDEVGERWTAKREALVSILAHENLGFDLLEYSGCSLPGCHIWWDLASEGQG